VSSDLCSFLSQFGTLVLRGRRLLHRFTMNRRSLSLFDQALISATNMCTTVIIARTCPKAQLGLYASGVSLVLLVTAIQSALIAVPYTISSPQTSGKEHALYKGSTILQQISLVGLGMLVFLLVSIFGFAHGNRGLQGIVFTLSAVSGLICFRDFARRISYAELHFGFALCIDGTLALLQLLAIGLLAWKHQLTASTALLAVGFASASASGMWVVVNWRTVSFSIVHAVTGFRINWALGRWLFASSVLWSLCIDQYPWLITALRAPSETAVWAASYGVMAFMNPIVLALNNDAAPRVANDYAAYGLRGLFRRITRSAGIAAMITLPVLIALLIFGSHLVKLMYGSKFGGAGTIVDLLAVGLWFYAIGLSFPYGMLALKRAGIDFAINVACITSFLAIGIWLIRWYGVVGAACSFLMVQTVALVLRIVGFQRVFCAAENEASALAVGRAIA
jgi:O-antigen/teichoic acid export membrane protein